MLQVKINLYSFNELSHEAQKKAIYEHLEFLDSLPDEFEDEEGELQKEYREHSEEEAIESIEANEYIFFADGELAKCTSFVGNHPRAGETEIKIGGETYTITPEKSTVPLACQ